MKRSVSSKACDEQLLHVRVVVVDRSASYACVAGDVGHGQAGKAVGEQKLTERGEDTTLGLGALGSVGGGRDPWHIDTLPLSVSKYP